MLLDHDTLEEKFDVVSGINHDIADSKQTRKQKRL